LLSVDDSILPRSAEAAPGRRPNRRGAHVKLYSRSADVLMIAVQGEIDASNAAHVALQMHGSLAMGRPVVVDMTDVEFLGAAGLLHIFAFDKACANVGTTWTLVASRSVRRLIDLVDVGRSLPVVSCLAEAVQRCASAAASNSVGTDHLRKGYQRARQPQ
jgi:anti-anti-sigma factor